MRCPACAASLVSTTRIEKKRDPTTSRVEANAPVAASWVRSGILFAVIILAVVLGAIGWERLQQDPTFTGASGVRFHLQEQWKLDAQESNGDGWAAQWLRDDIRANLYVSHRPVKMPIHDEAAAKRYFDVLVKILSDEHISVPPILYTNRSGRIVAEMTMFDMDLRQVPTENVPEHEFRRCTLIVIQEGAHDFLIVIAYSEPHADISRARSNVLNVVFPESP